MGLRPVRGDSREQWGDHRIGDDDGTVTSRHDRQLWAEAGTKVGRRARPQSHQGAGSGVADEQSPQPVDGDRPVVGAAQRAEQAPAVRVVDVDPAVTEVTDEQIAGERPEVRRCDRQGPTAS
jgi:hypothetical protein